MAFQSNGAGPSALAPTIAVRPDGIPGELKQLTQWVCWRYVPRPNAAKAAKIPYQPDGQPAKSNDAGTWHSYADCLAAYQSGQFAGIGVMLAGDLAGVDLDNCIDTSGQPTPAAAEVLARFAGSYAELSPSGTGYRILVYGQPQRSGKNAGTPKWLEVYAEGSARYLTCTGAAIHRKPITAQQPALDWMHEQYFKPAGASQPPPASQPDSGTTSQPPPPVFTILGDADLIEKATRKPDFAALWHGDTSAYGGDASGADMALAGMLAWWTNGDAAQAERMFRQSGLMRPKWDERRGETTYGQQTIAKAVANCRDGYTGNRPDGGAQRENSAGHDRQEKPGCREPGSDDEPEPPKGRQKKPLFVDAVTLTANPRAPDWLIRDWLPKNSLATLFGDPGTGKSLLALDWACCVASGRNWNGCRVKPGIVLYVVCEGFDGIARRLAAWQLANDPLPSGRLFVSERSVLMNAAGAAEVMEAVATLPEPPALVEVDTLARAIEGNENDAEDMGLFIRMVDSIRVTTGCAMLVLHHCGAADKNRPRGHTSLKGAVDAEFSIEKNGHVGLSGVIRCTKAKDSEPPPPLAFEGNIITLPESWWDKEEPDKPVAAATLSITGKHTSNASREKLSPATAIALAGLRDALVQHSVFDAGVATVTLDQWRDASCSMGISDSPVFDTRRRVFDRARKDLLVRGTVVCADERYWIPVPRRDQT